MAVERLPSTPHIPNPPEATDRTVAVWRKEVEKLLVHLAKWNREFYDRAPTVNDDGTFGYERGFLWLHRDTANNRLTAYMLADDPQNGAAVWKEVSGRENVDCWAVKLSAQTGFTIDVWAKITGWTERLDTHDAFASDAFTAPRAGTLRISANIWGGTPGAGSTNTQLLVGIFKNNALVTDSVRGSSIFAGYYDTQDTWWVGDTDEGDVWDVRAMFCPAAAGFTTTNATVGAYTEIDAGTTQLVSFCRYEMQFD